MTAAHKSWWRRDDHYYWLTSQLSARGRQPAAAGLLALATFIFGAFPAIMTLSPSGPQGRLHHTIALAVTAICIVLSLTWLRRGWPARRQSIGYVLTLSLCSAVVCLIQSNPVVGLLGCVAFGALAGYIALFHTARLLLINGTIAAVTAVPLVVRIVASGDVALAVCAGALIVFVNVVVPVIFHVTTHPLTGATPTADIDPLTGLLNRSAFYRVVGEQISVRARTDDRYLVIVQLVLDNYSLLTGTQGQIAGDQARIAVAQMLRETTRGDAVVAHSHNADFLIADTFQTVDVSPLLERVRSAIATTPPRLTASIGAVVTPLRALADLPPFEVVDKLVEIADTQVAEARRAGGNRACTIECAAPDLDDRSSDADEPW